MFNVLQLKKRKPIYYCFYEIEVISNETQTNEYIAKEYQETQSINHAPSISVKRFYNIVS